ncbi:MAG: hypothetical protein ACLS7Z_10650 [Christensenellales bacterium]
MKRPLFEAVGEVRERTFIYLGGHPMAGRERGGFAHATADLFRGRTTSSRRTQACRRRASA